jgi:hypothetical protein
MHQQEDESDDMKDSFYVKLERALIKFSHENFVRSFQSKSKERKRFQTNTIKSLHVISNIMGLD